MAKIAASRGKPRGFAVIDAEEAASLLAPESVRLLPGVGVAVARKLETIGITRLGQLQALQDRDVMRTFGDDGLGLIRRARGEGHTPR
jgi:DNA polymerase IV